MTQLSLPPENPGRFTSHLFAEMGGIQNIDSNGEFKIAP